MKAHHFAGMGLLLGLSIGIVHLFHPLFLRLKNGEWVFPGGKLLNPNSGNLGNPSEAEEEFRRIYTAILAFRKEKKRLPYAPQELAEFIPKGASKPLITQQDLVSSDHILSDTYAQGYRDHLGYVFDLRGKRPSGEDKPAFPKAGERDVWVSTDNYTRSNTVMFPDKSVRRSPSGFYLVLWSDGKIERIPTGDRLWANTSGGLEAHFPGQTGIPKTARKESGIGFMSGAVPAGYTDGPKPGP